MTLELNLFIYAVCDIETGQSNVILDINESLGTRKSFFTLFEEYT